MAAISEEAGIVFFLKRQTKAFGGRIQTVELAYFPFIGSEKILCDSGFVRWRLVNLTTPILFEGHWGSGIGKLCC